MGSTHKKCILFYRREMEKRVSLLIVGNQHPNCRLAPYSQVEEMETMLRTILESEPQPARLQ